MDEIPSSEFDFRDFDPRDFVQRYRKRLPLPQLQKSLRAHHSATRQELVELINEKYADFVNLSTRMQGVERALKPLRAPLMESAELTQGLHSKLAALLEQAESTHQSLAKIRMRKESLLAYIENAKMFDKAQMAAEQRWGNNPQESDDLLREHVAQENIARDLRRVRYNLAADPQCTTSTTADVPAECQSLLDEAMKFEEAFAGRIHERLHGLIAAIKRSWTSGVEGAAATEEAGGPPSRMELLALTHLARALATVGHANMVEEAFADVFVKSALEGAAAACTGGSEESSLRRSSEAGMGSSIYSAGAVNLGPFFHFLSSKLLAENAQIVWFSRCFCGSTTNKLVVHDPCAASGEDTSIDNALLVVPGLRILSNAVVAPVLKHVQQVWPNVFMPAFPDSFAANYVHAEKFISAAEAIMVQSEKTALSSNATLTDFRRKWKTQVYASLRAKEAGQQMEVSATKSRSEIASAMPATPPRSAGGQGFWFSISAEVMEMMDKVWREGWYLEPLYLKTLQLTLDLLDRFGREMRGILAATATSGAAQQPSLLARSAADVLAVLGQAEGEVLQRMLKHLPSSAGSDVSDLVGVLLREACGRLRPVLEEIESAMLQPVLAQAAAQFAAIRGIPAFYRMLNKPVPTKASPYVESAMRPLEALRQTALQAVSADGSAKEAPATSSQAAGVIANWMQRAVDSAAVEFSSQAAQLLESTHQQEASLRRLAGRGGSADDSKVSDLEKIHIQLCLDVEAFVSLAMDLLSCNKQGAEQPVIAGISKLQEVISPVRPTFEAHRRPA